MARALTTKQRTARLQKVLNPKRALAFVKQLDLAQIALNRAAWIAAEHVEEMDMIIDDPSDESMNVATRRKFEKLYESLNGTDEEIEEIETQIDRLFSDRVDPARKAVTR